MHWCPKDKTKCHLLLSGGELDIKKFKTSKVDKDIIPISDVEYLEDDIVSKLETL